MSQAFYYDEQAQDWKPIVNSTNINNLKEHVENQDIHVTQEDKDKWMNIGKVKVNDKLLSVIVVENGQAPYNTEDYIVFEKE